MKLLRIFAAAVMSLSLVGCCHNRCMMTDPCDPCGGCQPRGCGLSRMFNSAFKRGYSWDNVSSCSCGGCSTCNTCSTCGGGEMMDGYSYDGMSGVPMISGSTGSSGCGCSQPSQFSAVPTMVSPSYMNTAPTIAPSPPVVPQPIPEIPPSTPSSNTDNQSTMMHPGNGQPQMVSYEEFQKMPGTVISGPGAGAPSMSVPTPVQQVSTSTPSFAVPPSPAPSSVPVAGRTPTRFVRPTSGQQPVWTPAR